MSDAKETDPHVQDMRRQLADARRAARGVKDSARNLRTPPKSERLTRLTEEVMQEYDSRNPPVPHSEDTTRRFG